MAKLHDLAAELAAKHGLDAKAAEKFADEFFTVLNDGLHYDKQVKVKGLGTFKVTTVAPRESVDVNTGKRILIEGREKINFTPEASLRDAVNKPFAQFETVVVNDGVDFDAIDNKFAANEDAAVAEVIGVTEKEYKAAKEVSPKVSTAGSLSEKKAPIEDTPSVPKSDNNATLTSSPETTPPVATSDEASQLRLSSAEVLELNSPVAPATNEIVGGDNNKKGDDVADKPSEDVLEAEVGKPTEQQQDISIGEVAGNGEKNCRDTDGSASDTDNGSDATDDIYNINDAVSDGASANGTVAEGGSSNPLSTLQNELNKTHRMMKVAATVAAVLLVAVVGCAIYMTGQLRMKDNRIAHLEAQTVLQKAKPATSASATQPASVNDNMDSALDRAVEKADMAEKQAQAAKEQSKLSSSARDAVQKTDNNKSVATAEVMKKTAGNTTANKSNQPVAQLTKKTSAKTSASEDYNKDVRVRTGAYRIIGVSQTITVKKGQTLGSISRFYFGPGMECYVEAVNGGAKDVKPGDKIKIPELKHK